MPRIFLSLAAADFILLCGAGVLALVGSAQAPERHVLLAVLSLLLSCFIQVLVFTYLTVTGKMIAQAVHLARLDPQPLGQCKRLKSAVTAYLGIVLSAIVLSVATGAMTWQHPDPIWFHRGAVVLTLLAHVHVWRREYHITVENAQTLERTLHAYTAGKRDTAAGTGR